MPVPTRKSFKGSDSGVALILVLLAILVLTTLAAAMVFSARSETFASYNYRIGTQAEYVAQAGVQRALNFFNSASYSSLPPASASTYYDVSIYANNPTNLYYSNGTPVSCLGACTSGSGGVVLGQTTGSSRFPPGAATGGVDVIANWIAAMNNTSLSDGLGGTGNFTVTASLLDYHSVNNAFFGVPAAGCPDSMASLGICRQTYEVWAIRSRGTWNSNIGGGAASPTVEMVATIAPMYVPYFGSALYGLCNVTASGNMCTDSYNSSVGNYGGTVGACATPASTTSNAAAANAGIGSNGGVTINGSAASIGGNVTYANAATDASCNTGFQGTDSGIAGAVLPGPAIPTPPGPDMSAWDYTGTPPTNSSAPSAAPPSGGGGIDYRVTNVFMTGSAPPAPPGVAATCPGGFTGYLQKYTVSESGGGLPHTYTYGNYSCVGLTGDGSATAPYRLGAVDASGSGTRVINFIAPPDGVADPTYVAANSVTNGTAGYINLSGSAPATPANTAAGTYNPNAPANSNSALVLDVGDSVQLGGTATFNYNTATPGVPSPDFLKMNIMGTSDTALDLTGQAKLSAMITVPNGGARLQGSGAGGVFFGAILAKQVTDAGNYAVHYDLASRVQSGKLFVSRVVSVTRPKM